MLEASFSPRHIFENVPISTSSSPTYFSKSKLCRSWESVRCTSSCEPLAEPRHAPQDCLEPCHHTTGVNKTHGFQKSTDGILIVTSCNFRFLESSTSPSISQFAMFPLTFSTVCFSCWLGSHLRPWCTERPACIGTLWHEDWAN